jgi:cyclic-di-AMP phosphodiesterase PgpH
MKIRKGKPRLSKARGAAEELVRSAGWTVDHPKWSRIVLALVTAAILAAFMVEWRPLSGTRGVVVGEIAATDVRASRRFEVVDEQLTEEKQIQAREAVSPVFEHDVFLARGVQERTERAFTELRDWLEAQKAGEPTPDPGDEPGAAPDDDTSLGVEEPLEDAPDAGRPEPARIDPAALQERLDGFERTLGVEIEETDLATLQMGGFDATIQRDVQELIRSAMTDYVVLSTDQLPRDGGVRVIRVEGSKTSESQVETFDKVRDLAGARRFIAAEAAANYSDRPAHVVQAVVHMAGMLVVPNLRFDASETEVRRDQASDSVQPVITSYQPGQIILRSGDEVSEWDLQVLEEMNAGAVGYRPLWHHLALILLISLFLAFVERYGVRFISKFHRRFNDLLALSTLTIVVAGSAKLMHGLATALQDVVPSLPSGAYAYIVPVAVGGIVVRTLMNSETAVMWSLVTAVICADILGGGPWLTVFFLASSLAAAGGVGQASERGRLVRAGFVAAIANAGIIVALDLVTHTGIKAGGALGALEISASLYAVLFGLVGGIISGIMAVGFVPVFEALGFLTDSKLLELSNLNHPLVREMIVKAPGTYHHSMIVGSLGEAAAEAIHANSLLVRVGAYFHDVGKTRSAHYFVENQRGGDNPHDRLTPSMSALVVTNHVKEGIEIARQHKLPEPIVDMIPQHHGTKRVSFFYNKAVEQTDPDKGTVSESDYRYPGPKPQTKEAAIMMLADGAEAATRSLPVHTEGAIRARVGKIVNGVIADGQLDECPLTLKDLHVVSETFIQVLLGIHHQRIEYPPESKAGGKGGGGSRPATPTSSITLTVPNLTPAPDAVHPLELAAAERQGREPEDIRITGELKKDGSPIDRKPAAPRKQAATPKPPKDITPPPAGDEPAEDSTGDTLTTGRRGEDD